MYYLVSGVDRDRARNAPRRPQDSPEL